jgi:hypothetical protein
MNSRYSKIGALILALALVLPGLALAQPGGQGNLSRNNLAPQPVLIYTVADLAGSSDDTGGTTDRNLTTMIVYNTGLAIRVTTGDDNTSASGEDCNVETVQLSQADFGALLRDLRRAGAFRATGGPRNVTAGSRLVTVTVFSSGVGDRTTSVARTFSFFEDDQSTANGFQGRVNTVINNLMGDNFESGGSGS